MADAPPTMRALDRLSQLHNQNDSQFHFHFRLGAALKRRLLLLAGAGLGVILFCWLAVYAVRTASAASSSSPSAGTGMGTEGWTRPGGLGWKPPESPAPGDDGDEESCAAVDFLGLSAGGDSAGDAAPWGLPEMRAMVGRTRGYYVRDWSLGLGWGQMRFIIQAALVHAQLLNRTLVLPTYVYARACEFEGPACSAFAEYQDRDRTLGYGGHTGHDGWKVPLGVMIDLAHLRERHAVLLGHEFYALHSEPPTTESWTGMFNRHTLPGSLTLYTLPNSLFDPRGTLLVDRLLAPPTPWDGGSELGEKVRKRMRERLGDGGGGAMDWEDVKAHLAGGPVDVRKDEEVEAALREAGSAVVWSFKGELGMDFVKSTVHPSRQVGLASALRGFVQEFGGVTEDVFYAEGELHLNRKTGALRFTTQHAMADFQRTCVWDVRPPEGIVRLAARLAERMRGINGGRTWMGAHMRRGDMVQLGWVMEASLQAHLTRIKDRLKGALDVVRQVRDARTVLPYEVPGVRPNRDVLDLSPPLEHDKFFLATDAQDSTTAAYLRSNGAVLLSDLLTPADRRALDRLGQFLMLRDVQAALEQEVLAHAAFYYGHAMSAAGGAILEARARAGVDRRLALID